MVGDDCDTFEEWVEVTTDSIDGLCRRQLDEQFEIDYPPRALGFGVSVSSIVSSVS